MRWRFKLDPNLTNEEITLESIVLKYESILAQLFIYIDIKIQENLIESTIQKFQLYISLFNFNENLNLIKNTYMELIYKIHDQDALIFI